MKKHLSTSILAFLLMLTSCSMEGDLSSSSSASPSGGQGNSGTQNQAGVITAGEWNDLDNWDFWETLIKNENFVKMPAHWAFYPQNRISVQLSGPDAAPVNNALVKLKRDGTTLFTARTDNKGKAELWVDLFQGNVAVDYSKLTLDINNGATTLSPVKPFKEGVNRVVTSPLVVDKKIELAFVVDATGSMGDELEYLKTELLDVINRAKIDNPNTRIATASVFYRDEGDDYVTRVSNFTFDNATTLAFIKNQSAGGGGDFPEAVHTALDKAVNELQWSTDAQTRLLFLVLDAPPHQNNAVTSSIQASVQKAAEKGIKLIPITASGIDKETEFLMRFLSMSTNGTYVFITNHSGIGNPHLEASVGSYQVEYLNNLMVRLINKYSR